jgi:uncharacterized protein GlcG (DUF336 family)
MKKLVTAALVFLAPLAAAPAQQAAPAYGDPIRLEQAKRLVAAAGRAARERNFNMAFAVVEPSGSLVLFERMDGTQYGSVAVAQEKARTAVMFRRPTKAFEEAVAGGRTAVLSLPGVAAIEGGTPIIVGGRIVGAIGVSGGSSAQDGEIAAAALAALK